MITLLCLVFDISVRWCLGFDWQKKHFDSEYFYIAMFSFKIRDVRESQNENLSQISRFV